MRQAGPAAHLLSRIDNEVIRFAPFAVLVFDEDDVVEIANPEALRILEGCSGLTEVVGIAVGAVFPGVDFSKVGPDSLFQISAQGKHFAIELQCVEIRQEDCRKTIVYLSQAGGCRQRELLLEKEASTDELSGLANRRAFQRTMESNQHRTLSLAIVDIDEFKLVNDRHGHTAGDDVIQLVSSQLQQSFNDNAILITRMGGDEFSILFETIDVELIVESLNEFREKIDSSQLPHQPDVKVNVSIGIAISMRASVGTRRLLTEADQQLYIAKQAGRNRVAHVLLDQ